MLAIGISASAAMSGRAIAPEVCVGLPSNLAGVAASTASSRRAISARAASASAGAISPRARSLSISAS